MQQRRKPRALTLTLPSSRQPLFLHEGRRYPLRNFSEAGIGLWIPTREGPPFGMKPGDCVKGDIVVDNDIFPVELELAYENGHLHGLRIVHQSPELLRLFQDLLGPTRYAGELRLHEESGTEDETMGCRKLWLVGTRSELLCWVRDAQKMIQALQVCWAGNWVYRAQLLPAQTGLLKDPTAAPLGQAAAESDLVMQHRTADPKLLQEAAQFLGSILIPLIGHLLWQFLETGEQVYLPADVFALGRKVA